MHDAQILHELTLNYRLTGSGWAECDVSAGGSSVTITASYLSDALGQLAAAALLLRLGAPCARVSFDEEPGEYRWGFDWHRSPDNQFTSIRIRIWEFAERWSCRPDEQGDLRFDKVIFAPVFFSSVRKMLKEVHVRYGEWRYYEQWVEYPYPSGVVADLCALLDERPEWPG